MPLIFKASFDKANRSSFESFRGPGIIKGLDILNDIKVKYNIVLFIMEIDFDIHGGNIEQEARKLDLKIDINHIRQDIL